MSSSPPAAPTYNAGVACADCHMPYTRDGAAKFSPTTSAARCSTRSGLRRLPHGCHLRGPTGWPSSRNQVRETMIATEDALVDAIGAIEAAAASAGSGCSPAGRSPPACTAKPSCAGTSSPPRTAWASTTPEEALRILAAATDLARQAQLKAHEAGPQLAAPGLTRL
jgi:nitrite reductase (cytochrome c-552)